MDQPALYFCLGDSMSIDLYPYLELCDVDSQAQKEVGAGSLLYSNDTKLWPEFEGDDLVSYFPGMRLFNLSEDGATTFDMLDPDYWNLTKGLRDLAAIATVTVGGNDILRLLSCEPDRLETELGELIRRYEMTIDLLEENLPRAIILLSSIYDPTDGTGILPGFPPFADKVPYLARMNEHIRQSAENRGELFADVHAHFFGHGLTVPQKERYYWSGNPIEPSLKGASELRRVWLDLLRAENIVPDRTKK